MANEFRVSVLVEGFMQATETHLATEEQAVAWFHGMCKTNRVWYGIVTRLGVFVRSWQRTEMTRHPMTGYFVHSGEFTVAEAT